MGDGLKLGVMGGKRSQVEQAKPPKQMPSQIKFGSCEPCELREQVSLVQFSQFLQTKNKASKLNHEHKAK